MAGIWRLAFARVPKLKLTEDADMHISKQPKNCCSGKAACEPGLQLTAELFLHGGTALS